MRDSGDENSRTLLANSQNTADNAAAELLFVSSAESQSPPVTRGALKLFQSGREFCFFQGRPHNASLNKRAMSTHQYVQYAVGETAVVVSQTKGWGFNPRAIATLSKRP